jgi:predicted metal-binding membrane protein
VDDLTEREIMAHAAQEPKIIQVQAESPVYNHHCRNPLGFLMTNWFDGRLGALRMGAGNGMFCLGCRGALMCVLFAVGVMNLLWVAALTGFVLVEKFGPAPSRHRP